VKRWTSAQERRLYRPWACGSTPQHRCQPDEPVVIDMTNAHIWDASTVATPDAVTTKYAAKGKTVTIIGMNDDSAARHQRLAGNLGAGH
jgi:MFS superfamily sulfate permease-like transporter